jgi:hypothetical protein
MKHADEPAKGKQEGFKRVSAGWHIFEFQEGIAKLQNKEQELSKNKDGDQLWKFPTKVNDEDDADHETAYDIILAENDQGDKWLVRYMKASNATKFAAFEKAYPGEHSFFEEAIIQKIMASKNQLTGERIRLKIEVRDNKKDANNPFYNVVAWAAVSEKLEDVDSELFAGKGAGKKEAGKKAPAVDDESF